MLLFWLQTIDYKRFKCSNIFLKYVTICYYVTIPIIIVT